MKKYLLSLIIATFALCANAQTEVLKINLGDRVVSYKVADIQEMTFDVVEENVDTTLFRSFNGYIFVSTNYFQDSYYGNNAVLSVYKTSLGEFIVTFSDPVWGEASFSNVQVGQELSGAGTITMSDQRTGNVNEYEATISGPMTTPVITIPSVMGGTTITFHAGTAPDNYQLAGSYQGNITVMVGGQFGPYVMQNANFNIQANADGTINVVMPEYNLANTVIGDLTIGTYSVNNIAYNEEKGSFYYDYSGDNLSFHFKAVKDGVTTMDSDYTITQLGNIEVKAVENGISITNNFQPGNMPFPIVATFVGTK